MSLSKAFLTSKSQYWETPNHIMNKFEKEYDIVFTRDLCASDDNHKCTEYYTEKDDGLQQTWLLDNEYEANFCNPPYGNGLVKQWVRRAWTHEQTTNTVLLLPINKCDQPWFHEFVVGNALVLFVKGRIAFIEHGNPIKGNSQGSMLIAFGPSFEAGIGSFEQNKEM